MCSSEIVSPGHDLGLPGASQNSNTFPKQAWGGFVDYAAAPACAGATSGQSFQAKKLWEGGMFHHSIE